MADEKGGLTRERVDVSMTYGLFPRGRRPYCGGGTMQRSLEEEKFFPLKSRASDRLRSREGVGGS